MAAGGWRLVLSWLRRAFSRRRVSFGLQGERAAERFLKRQGYIILARGERGRIGELDLIAVDGRVVVFVEVKTRRSNVAGRPDEAVTLAKQAKLTKLALAYLKRHDLLEHRARFDVVSVTWPQESRRPRIEHLINAFEPVGQRRFFG